MSSRDRVATILAVDSVALVMAIAFGSFGRAFYLAVVTGECHPISDAATQLLTALGSALVGGATGYLSGISSRPSQGD
jgi:hypothetical protein